MGVAVVLPVAVALAVVYHQTGRELRGQLDTALRANASELAQAIVEQPHGSADAVLSAAQRYARSQPYENAAVLLFAIVPGHGTASNHPELVTSANQDDDETSGTQATENRDADRLATPHVGYSTVPGADVGMLRVFQERVPLGDDLTAYAAAAEPLSSIDRAQNGVLRSFALAGALALVLALALAVLTAARVSRPLRRAARTAARIDGGDLSPRLTVEAPASSELHVLADALNHMLDRLADAFASQRAFIADASHELRTPLTVIRGQLDLLASAEDVTQDEVRRVEQLLQAETTRLVRLTDDLLLLARLDDRRALRPQPVEVTPFITDLWDGLSLTAERDFAIGPLPALTISADPDRLAQALRNIATNAVAHTDAPDGLITVSAEHHGGRLIVTIDDDGPGIPRDQWGTVFDRFHRTDQSRSRLSGGTGLGLAIVRAIIEAHAGTVAVSEAPTGGARFLITLPV